MIVFLSFLIFMKDSGYTFRQTDTEPTLILSARRRRSIGSAKLVIWRTVPPDKLSVACFQEQNTFQFTLVAQGDDLYGVLYMGEVTSENATCPYPVSGTCDSVGHLRKNSKWRPYFRTYMGQYMAEKCRRKTYRKPVFNLWLSKVFSLT